MISARAYACPCGAALPQDRRIKFCDACRGARAKKQDAARSAAKLEAWRQSIWWLHFANALKVALFVRAGNADPSPWHLVAAAKEARVQLGTLEAALDAEAIDARAYRRLCKWLGQAPETFTHKARDPLAELERHARAA